MEHDDPFHLERFVAAQERVYDDAVAELRRGCKESHWIWFIFPQIDGLGHSATARHYAIKSPAEARAYLAHPVLGPRLLECVRLVGAVEGRSVSDIFGYPDDLKFRSCMTLFARVAPKPEAAVFERLLAKYFGGVPDQRTLDLLNPFENAAE